MLVKKIIMTHILIDANDSTNILVQIQNHPKIHETEEKPEISIHENS